MSTLANTIRNEESLSSAKEMSRQQMIQEQSREDMPRKSSDDRLPNQNAPRQHSQSQMRDQSGDRHQQQFSGLCQSISFVNIL